MSDQDDDLILSYTRGEAGDADLRNLARRLATDDDGARRLAARLSEETLLAGWFRSDADAGFVEETAAAVGTPTDDPEFLAQTLWRIERRRRTPRPVPTTSPFSPVFAAVAAALLLAFGLLLWSSLSAPAMRPTMVALPRAAPTPIEIPALPPPRPAPLPEPVPPIAPVTTPNLAPPPPPEIPHPPTPPPVPPPPAPAPAPRETVVAVARFERIEGSVGLWSSEGRSAVTTPSDLPPGRSIEVGTPGRALLKFPDSTSIDLGPGTRLEEIAEGEGGKRLTLTQGSLSADVTKQPVGKPFVILTPHGEARVVGTILKLVVDVASTRLEVTEGKVRLTRPDKKAVDVAAGQFVVSAAGLDLVSRSLEGFTLKDIPAQGLALWLRADSGVTTTGGAVSAWADQSGNRREAVQETAAKRPVLIPDAVRHRPALRFDGVDDVLAATLPVEGLGGLTIAIVAANAKDYAGGATHGENAAIFWPETADWGWVYLSPFQSNVKFRFGTTQPNNLPFHIRAASTSAFTLSVAVKDGPVDSLYVQGTLAERYAGKAPAIKGTQPLLHLGAGARDTGFPGDIAEVLIYNRALSNAERQRLERALIGKYFR